MMAAYRWNLEVAVHVDYMVCCKRWPRPQLLWNLIKKLNFIRFIIAVKCQLRNAGAPKNYILQSFLKKYNRYWYNSQGSCYWIGNGIIIILRAAGSCKGCMNNRKKERNPLYKLLTVNQKLYKFSRLGFCSKFL